jgi:hypothetical protein
MLSRVLLWWLSWLFIHRLFKCQIKASHIITLFEDKLTASNSWAPQVMACKLVLENTVHLDR